MKDFHILVQAREAAGVTPVLARLKPLPAAQADAADLKLYQVREAVAFKVDVPGANILVDGQPAGTAQQFGGRFAQPGSWLRLDRGRHRVSVVAPGGRRQDFLVEVGGGADKDKDRIEVSLRGEG